MIGAVMLYSLVTGFLAYGAGVALERAAARLRRPRRWGWLSALSLPFVLAALLPVMPPASAAPPTTDVDLSPALPTIAPMAVFSSGQDALRAPLAAAATSVTRFDTMAGAIWILTTGLLATGLVRRRLAMERDARRWRSVTCDSVPILVSHHTGPAVVGLLKPRIVLPEWALALAPAEREMVIRHEVEHVRAGDSWLVHVAAVALAAMAWNPAAWVIARRLRLAIEIDCDARVLAAVVDAGERDRTARYAHLLVTVAERDPGTVSLAPALGEPASTLRRRIAAMTHAVGRFNRTRAGAAASVAAAIAFVAFVVPMPRATAEAAPVMVLELGGQPTQDPAPSPSVTPEPSPSPSPTPSPTPSAAQDPAPTPVVVPAGSGSEPTVRRFTIVSIPDPREPAPQGDTFGRGAYRLGLNWSLPVVLKRITPVYTPEAATAGIEGTVLLDAVVGVDGRVADLRIARSLNKELGLDDAALDAARQWLFEPATRDGEPLPVIVRLELEFKLP